MCSEELLPVELAARYVDRDKASDVSQIKHGESKGRQVEAAAVVLLV